MELFLNLLWLLIAVGLVSLWRICWLPQKHERGREPLREWTAVGCALVVLFFAVSLTDDLHSEVMLQDEISANRRHSIGSHHAPRPGGIVRHADAVILPEIRARESLRFDSRLVLLGSCSREFFLRGVTGGRAPPLQILRYSIAAQLQSKPPFLA